MGNWTFPCMTYCSQLLGPWRGTWSHRWARDPDTPREQQGTCDPDTPREQQGTCDPDTPREQQGTCDPDTPREQQGTCDPDTPREQQGTCGPDTRDRCSLRLAGPISKALA
eukprot:1159604-Pelagomonas_calceolata.AAC.4